MFRLLVRHSRTCVPRGDGTLESLAIESLELKKKFKKYFLQKSKTHLPIHLRRGNGRKGLLSMTSSEARDLFQIANRWLKEREQGSLYLDTSRLETAQTKKKRERNTNNF
jgi:hypothetical protein